MRPTPDSRTMACGIPRVLIALGPLGDAFRLEREPSGREQRGEIRALRHRQTQNPQDAFDGGVRQRALDAADDVAEQPRLASERIESDDAIRVGGGLPCADEGRARAEEQRVAEVGGGREDLAKFGVHQVLREDAVAVAQDHGDLIDER